MDTPTPVQLRPAVAGDHEDVARILIESRLAFMPYAPIAHSPAGVRDWVQTALLPGDGITVATLGDSVAGVLASAEDYDCRWIRHLWIAPALVVQGIGSRLLDDALARSVAPISCSSAGKSNVHPSRA